MSHMLRDISAPSRIRPFVAICACGRPHHSTVALHRVRHRTDRQTMVAHTVSIALDHGETFKGVVQLSCFVSSQAAESKAVEVARTVGGVKSVKNDMRLK